MAKNRKQDDDKKTKNRPKRKKKQTQDQNNTPGIWSTTPPQLDDVHKLKEEETKLNQETKENGRRFSCGILVRSLR